MKFNLVSFAINIKSSDFNRSVLKVFSGTFIAQVITIIVSPILTRIYSPSDFSNLAFYLSIVSILSVIVTLKYDKAIILPRENLHALALVVLSILISICISLLVIFLYVLCGVSLASVFRVEEIGSWLIFVPVTALARAMYTILNTWFNREKNYVTLSKNRVFTTGLSSILKILLQVPGRLGAIGLVFSEVISQVISLYLFGLKFIRENFRALKALRRQEILYVAKKYKFFPLLSMPADFIGILSRELPVILLTAYFNSDVVGYYMLTLRTIEAPLTLLSTSILEVFKQKANEEYHNFGNCKGIFLSTMKKLIVFSFVPFLFVFIFAPTFFSFIFGAQWSEAGEYARILTIMYFFKFIASPLSYVFYIVDKLKIDLILHFLILSVSAGSILLGVRITNNANTTLMFFSVGYSLVYFTYLVVSYKLSKG